MLSALALLATFHGPAQARPAIPPMYQGEWNMHAKDCGTSRNDSTLRLRSGAIAYFESAGPVRAVVVRNRELALVAELSGEGETRLHAAHFQLSRDGRTLTDVMSAPPLVRYRCPTRRKQ